MLSLLLLACHPPTQIPTDSGTPVVEDSGSAPLDTADTAGAPPYEETVPDQELDDAWLFDRSAPRLVEIELEAGGADSLRAHPEQAVEATVTVDGVEMSQAALWITGDASTWAAYDARPSFEIRFDQNVGGRRLMGIAGIVLAAGPTDCSGLRELLAAEVYAGLDLPAPRAALAQVEVGGEVFGLYTLLETPEQSFLARRFESGAGNLYDGAAVWDGGEVQSYLDLGEGVDALFPLLSGSSEDHADLQAISAALLAHAEQADFNEALGSLVDWTDLHRLWVAEQWLGHAQGNGLGLDHTRLYVNPSDGLLHPIPFGAAATFQDEAALGLSWQTPAANLMAACLTNADCRLAHEETVVKASDLIDGLDLGTSIAELSLLAGPWAYPDPRATCTPAEQVVDQDALALWVAGRTAALRVEWGR